tara:strand:+ start:119 stop:622 length:504 start_codon:yes stop_codon:yes gene_type:complete
MIQNRTTPVIWNVDPEVVGQAMGITAQEYVDSVSGSTASSVIESKVAQFVDGERVKGSQLPYDVIAGDGRYIEVRCICKTKNVYFSPSTATGKGRFFSEEDYQKKLDACDSYVFADLRDRFQSPVRFFEISVDKVRDLTEKGIIKQGKVGIKLFFELFPYEQYALTT